MAHELAAVARARIAEVGLAVHERLAVGDREQAQVLPEVVAAGLRHHDLAVFLRAEDAVEVGGAGERLEAEAGVRVDFADRLDPELHAALERRLAELEPLDAEPDARAGPLERGGGLERAERRTPRRVHRGGVSAELLREERGKRLARAGRAVVVARLVEELVGEGARAVRPELLRARAPERAPDVAALVRDEAVADEVAGAVRIVHERARRRAAALVEGQAAVRPRGRGEVEDARQAALPEVRGEVPVDQAAGALEAGFGAVFAHPRRGDLAAGGVEAEALQVVAGRRRLVDPGVLRRVAGAGLEPGLVGEREVVERAEQKARFSVDEKVAVRTDFETGPLGHPERGLEFLGVRKERLRPRGGERDSGGAAQGGADGVAGLHASDYPKTGPSAQARDAEGGGGGLRFRSRCSIL